MYKLKAALFKTIFKKSSLYKLVIILMNNFVGTKILNEDLM